MLSIDNGDNRLWSEWVAREKLGTIFGLREIEKLSSYQTKT
jgi:hypothetical protein